MITLAVGQPSVVQGIYIVTLMPGQKRIADNFFVAESLVSEISLDSFGQLSALNRYDDTELRY